MKDRFSDIAGSYAAFRPSYPPALYDFITRHLTHLGTAWDAGTGNGQAARDLALRFNKVYATDISAKQLAGAAKAANIVYSVAGETTTLADHSIDLITVAQAIHWFNRPLFYDEVRRVATKEAVLAVWGYGLVSFGEEGLDKMMQHFYSEVVGPYWDPERKLIDEHYRKIEFPFQEITTPEFEIVVSWTREEFEGYLNTWSAVQNYIKARNENPVNHFIREIASVWGEGVRGSCFPVFMRMGAI